jgi:hypothetical protein
MTTTNTQHKGNGDTSTHYDNATIANARKFYALIDDNGREEAKRIVDDLVKMGKLQSSEFYVKAYKDEVSRRENLAKRKERRANEEAEEKAKAKKREEDDRKAEEEAKKGESIRDEDVIFVQKMIDENNTVPQIRGFLSYKGYSLKAIKAYLATLDLKKAKTRAIGERERFMNMFIELPMSEETFKEYIANGSDNVKRRATFYRAMFNTFNAIHARYNG